MEHSLTRREMMTRLALAAPITGLVLSQTGCGSLTNDIELILATAEAAVDIALPQYAALLTPYFTEVTMFIDELSMELASTATAAQKAAAIASDAAAIIVPVLTGVPAEIVTDISKIGQLIANLVDELKASAIVIEAAPNGANAFFEAHKKLKPPSAADLEKIRQRNAKLKAKIASKHSYFRIPFEMEHLVIHGWNS
jgi:hypothetical protein